MITTIIDRKPRAEPITANQEVTKPAKQHVVIVEDEPGIVRALQIQLELCFDMLCFNNAEEALPYIRKNSQAIDLLILDYMLLGNVDGLELLSIIKQDPSMEHIPVIFQTANDRSILNKVAARPDYYLEKPWSMQQMRNAIQDVLCGSDRTATRQYSAISWQANAFTEGQYFKLASI